MSTPQAVAADPAAFNRPARSALPPALHPEQRLNGDQVDALIGVRPSKRKALVRSGTFPKPIVQEPKYTRWRAGDVLAWLEQQRGQQ